MVKNICYRAHVRTTVSIRVIQKRPSFDNNARDYKSRAYFYASSMTTKSRDIASQLGHKSDKRMFIGGTLVEQLERGTREKKRTEKFEILKGERTNLQVYFRNASFTHQIFKIESFLAVFKVIGTANNTDLDRSGSLDIQTMKKQIFDQNLVMGS